MKKYIVLLILILSITGCSGKYELEVKNEKVTEKTTALYDKNEVVGDVYDYTLDIISKYDDNGDFLRHDSKKNIKEDDKIGFMLKSSYSSISDFSDSSKIINYCYDAINVSDLNNEITLKTSKKFNCLEQVEEIDDVTIVIKTNHKLKETNADKKTNTTYYWYIDKDNYKDKPISLVLYSNKKIWYYGVLEKLILIISVIGGTVLLVYVGYRLYKKKEENVNF